MTAAVAQVFQALGDPVRLEMVNRLLASQPCTIAAVSAGLGITRQGARKHLQILVDAALVSLTPEGREVRVALHPTGLDPIKAFLARLEQQWDGRLDALKRFAERGGGA